MNKQELHNIADQAAQRMAEVMIAVIKDNLQKAANNGETQYKYTASDLNKELVLKKIIDYFKEQDLDCFFYDNAFGATLQFDF